MKEYSGVRMPVTKPGGYCATRCAMYPYCDCSEWLALENSTKREQRDPPPDPTAGES